MGAVGAVEELAARQYGLVTREQALELGLSRGQIGRQVDGGRWRAIAPGLYRFAAAPVNWEQRLFAACLGAGPGAVVSHATAGLYWNLDGIGRVSRDVVEVTVPYPRDPRPRPGVIVHRSRVLPPKDCAIKGRIPVTSLPRTLIDLAPRLDDKMLECALEDVIRRRDDMFVYVSDRLRKLAHGRVGSIRLRAQLFDHLNHGIDYGAFETYVTQLLATQELPKPEHPYKLQTSAGNMRELDYAYPRVRVGVEADGYTVHGRKKNFFKDRNRMNELTADGWHIIHVTSEHIRKQDPAIGVQVREILKRRGYPLPSRQARGPCDGATI